MTRADAIEFFQYLLEERMINSIDHKQRFEDNKDYYRFQEDEMTKVLNHRYIWYHTEEKSDPSSSSSSSSSSSASCILHPHSYRRCRVYVYIYVMFLCMSIIYYVSTMHLPCICYVYTEYVLFKGVLSHVLRTGMFWA